MTWARLGPLGGLRDIPNPTPETVVESSRAETTFPLLGGYVHVQRSPRRARAWRLGHIWQAPELLAYLTACAEGAIPGPLYLHTQDAALTNLLPSDVAAPCRMGTVALGSVAGTVAVGMPGGTVPMSGVVQQATAGAWSAIVPVRQVSHVLSAWASAAGAVVEWRTVTAAGVQVATGTVTAAAVAGGFYGAVSIVPGASVAGVQVRLAAGSLTVGGLRLVEGVLPSAGVEVRRNLASDPRGTALHSTASRIGYATGRWGGVGATATYAPVAGATDGPEVAPGVRLSTYIRKTWTVAATNNGSSGFQHTATAAAPVTPGATYTISSWMRSAGGGQTAAAGVLFKDAGGANLGSEAFAPVVTLAAGTWTRVSYTFTAPAGAATAALFSDVRGGTLWPVGATLDGTGLLVEEAGSVLPYMDGATSPDPGLLPEWTSTPNASPSVLKAIPEGAVWPGWAPGVGVPQVVVGDPQQTLQLATTTEVRSDYTITIREVG